MACYGSGEPTDNARIFYEQLMSTNAKNLEQMKYAVSYIYIYIINSKFIY